MVEHVGNRRRGGYAELVKLTCPYSTEVNDVLMQTPRQSICSYGYPASLDNVTLVGGVGWGKRGHEKGGGMVDYSFILSMH